MKIRLAHGNLSKANILKAQKAYRAVYIGDFSISDYVWESIFYCPNPDLEKGHSYLFSLTKERIGLEKTGRILIADASVFAEKSWTYCHIKSSNTLHISCGTHHNVLLPPGFIDGGSSYCRTSIMREDCPVGMTKLDFKNLGENAMRISPTKRAFDGSLFYDRMPNEEF